MSQMITKIARSCDVGLYLQVVYMDVKHSNNSYLLTFGRMCEDCIMRIHGCITHLCRYSFVYWSVVNLGNYAETGSTMWWE